ncbi:transposase [Streptomyces zaomyceticus]|uniref:transposase n=2 Tax=Streptomyces TaxID=1883 RepID=UPI0036A4D9A1
MGKKKPRPRRSFTAEFKAEIVELCRRGDRSVGQVAKDFELTETAVRSWVRQAEVDAGERDGLTSSEREELAALRRENRRLREDVDILKRATAFFATETRCGAEPWAGVLPVPKRIRSRGQTRSTRGT